jgi:CRP-like cAMP-binding protein
MASMIRTDYPVYGGVQRSRGAVNTLVVPAGRFPGLEPVILRAGQVLHAPGEPIRHVYFPTGALVSLFTDTPLPGDVSMEVALIGSEGMVGVSLALGARRASTEALVLAAGPAMRASSQDFLRALERIAGLRSRTLRYSSELADALTRSAACSRNHSTRQRLARWLVMAHMRLGHAEVRLTQQSIARALSTRRTGVNAAAVELKRRGLIRYRRGVMEIVDVAGLRAMACPCYGRQPLR